MTSDFVFYLGVALLGLFVSWLLFLPFMFYRFCAVIREKQPDVWAAHGGRGLIPATRWIASVIFGRIKLDIPDDDYRRLSRVRRWIGRCLLYLLAGLGMIAWAASQ